MNSKGRYPRNKNNFTRNLQSKFIIIFSSLSIVFLLVAGQRYLFAPSTAGLDTGEITARTQGNSQNTSMPSNKNSQEEVEFTFFDTLAKPGKYTTSKKNKKSATVATLEKKEEEKIEPPPPESKEIEKPEAPHPTQTPKFFIQMGSFQDKSRAETFVSMLNKKGYETLIKSAEVLNKGLWYRIFLKEGFSDKKSALKLIEKIKRKDDISALLKRSSS